MSNTTITLILVLIFFALTIMDYSRRTFGVQLLQVLSLGVSFFVAKEYFLPLAEKLELIIPFPGYSMTSDFSYYPDAVLTNMDVIYYRAMAFALILVGVQVIKSFILYLFSPSKYRKGQGKVLSLGGFITGFITAWFTLFFVFAILSLLGLEGVQGFLSHNSVAEFFIRRTPFLTHEVFNLWFAGIALAI
ncbi:MULTISPECIES: CvpA family protein [Aerococcus]|uniref:CvpA family protein n=2 Tax=Aerococcus TaxID=1375 RepID=A0A1E9PEC6_9LACT|nr:MULTISPECIES: CvpA family protein [Aerococcus]KAA9242137.1 CvpA family protein [Aerococcus urinae]KAA9290898.1 CvpA family protein [Aerococcus mictus]KAA9297450.1 CvpA family protein [Aerococcus tenax]MCY3034064.1 CvpA family protein [Aerococcus mictus]MCY3064281.1 CvpA family protein [Aerococcus mictus]